ncbi:protein aurora borealis [Tiliqua scincoides]|uniref:protein aurora borealis n=1 Tax=Tiliqua scincoides TaxID=71010 RepID=UPI003461F6FC
MSDAKQMQIGPDPPGWFPVQNPFESPSDYSHLQEQIVLSPSVFRSTKSSMTPGKFGWSIDELALINPVEIDSEEISRQALYLSHASLDKETEEKRQQAIEEFFTKSIIVPSPWTGDGKQVSQFNSTRCIALNNASPVGRDVAVQPGKNNAACQTILSLPVDFDLEKILGEYFKPDELADQSQESLSTSSLRRKLFLDENGSLSENSSPSPQCPRNVRASLGVLCSIDISPVRCRSPLNTSSSGQFSSSPIQGGKRASLGSIASPSFPERRPANVTSPTISPIGIQIRKTPLSEQRQFTFRSPDIPSVSSSCRSMLAGTRSSYTECSPLKNCSPMRLMACRGATLYQTSIVRLPSTPESVTEEEEEGAKASSAEAPLPAEAAVNLHQLNGDSFSQGTHLVVARVSISPDSSEANTQGLSLLYEHDCFKEIHTVDMADPEEMSDENSVKGSARNIGMPLTGFSIESSCMFLPPLAESSSGPCESSSIQVDSGYNTQTCTSSLMDTAGVETSSRENDMHAYGTQNKFQVFRTKQGKLIPRYWTETERGNQSISHLIEMPLSK